MNYNSKKANTTVIKIAAATSDINCKLNGAFASHGPITPPINHAEEILPKISAIVRLRSLENFIDISRNSY